MDQTGDQLRPLYRRLPHGPNGLARETVARNQRARLLGATVEAVARNGYEGTTVAHVIALAGVSRRAFYELFANKQECFLAAYDLVEARHRRRLLEGWRAQHGWSNRMHGASAALLDTAAAAPNGPQLALIESLVLGEPARTRAQLGALRFERMVSAALRRSPASRRHPPLAARAFAAGVRQLVLARVRDGRAGELRALAPEVVDWVECSRLAGGEQLSPLALGARNGHHTAVASPRGRGGARERLLAALVELTVEGLGAPLSGAHVAQRAGLPGEAFQEHFADPGACLLAALDELSAEALAPVPALLDGCASWEQAVCLSLAAVVRHLTASPALQRLAFIDVFAAGPGGAGRFGQPLGDLVAMLASRAPRRGQGGPILPDVLTGALWGILAACVPGGRLARLSGIEEHLAFTVLAPYVGARAAVAAIAAERER